MKIKHLHFLGYIFLLSACGSSDTGTLVENNTDDEITPPSTTSALYSENFTATDNSPWPSPWSEINTVFISSDIQNNMARLQGSPSSVTRMITTGLAMTNFEAIFIVSFEAVISQGIGLYGRQNGGLLTTTPINGQGYGVFLEGNGQQELSLWREINGEETLITSEINPLGVSAILNNTNYYIRYRVQQISATETRQQAKIWITTNLEPIAWSVETTSSYPELQNIAGNFAVDVFNYSGNASVFIDDLEITNLDI